MAKQNDKEKDEEEIVMVGPGSDEAVEDQDDDEESPKEKERKNEKDPDDEESEEEDARAGHGEESGEEEDEEKPNTRESRKARRERQKRARERSEREIRFLRQRNEVLEKQHTDLSGRVSATEVSAIDSRVLTLKSQLATAQNVEAEAIKQGEGDEAIEARRIQDKLKENIGKLERAKDDFTRREEPGSRVDPNLVRQAQEWVDDNSWYDPKGNSKDSRTVLRLDRQLLNEGFDPKTPEYWEELTDRTKKALPHRFKEETEEKEEDEKPARKNGEHRSSGPKFSTGGRERALAKNEVYITPERKQAMIDAGVWEDKVLRTRYLKNYQKWDRENKDSRGRDR